MKFIRQTLPSQNCAGLNYNAVATKQARRLPILALPEIQDKKPPETANKKNYFCKIDIM